MCCFKFIVILYTLIYFHFTCLLSQLRSTDLPGYHVDFLKEIAYFLSELVVTVDKALFVGDFNIHVDNPKDALGLAFMDVLNSLYQTKRY